MEINIGYLTSDTTPTSDERFTPFYCVEPIIKYIEKDKIIWCPFDKEWSAYVKRLRENGNTVISSSIEDGYDFFEYEPENYDIIISNPPFSKKRSSIKKTIRT